MNPNAYTVYRSPEIRPPPFKRRRAEEPEEVRGSLIIPNTPPADQEFALLPDDISKMVEEYTKIIHEQMLLDIRGESSV